MKYKLVNFLGWELRAYEVFLIFLGSFFCSGLTAYMAFKEAPYLNFLFIIPCGLFLGLCCFCVNRYNYFVEQENEKVKQ